VCGRSHSERRGRTGSSARPSSSILRSHGRHPSPDSKAAQEGLGYYFKRARQTGRPDVSDGEPWSDMDIADLKNHVARGASLDETATFLCRAATADEVALKAKELGLKWKKIGRQRRQ
jgi:hypothetical protein